MKRNSQHLPLEIGQKKEEEKQKQYFLTSLLKTENCASCCSQFLYNKALFEDKKLQKNYLIPVQKFW